MILVSEARLVGGAVQPTSAARCSLDGLQPRGRTGDIATLKTFGPTWGDSAPSWPMAYTEWLPILNAGRAKVAVPPLAVVRPATVASPQPSLRVVPAPLASRSVQS